tara:strand:+ start:152 stop:262 length:111 start_codon:yes stop_codon:yes gene_type:complete
MYILEELKVINIKRSIYEKYLKVSDIIVYVVREIYI